ncbi:hypothetical protein LUZ60_007667 [Juncus effusus]|nr:hypothetical protein LUZ60_007667 [Juncus effusus]
MERPPPSPSSSLVSGPAPTTTFVQTDQSTFKELVQRLTGPNSTCTSTSTGVADHQQYQHQQYPHQQSHPPSPTGKLTGIMKRRPAFKAQSHKPKLTIVKPGPVNPSIFIGPNIVSPSSKVAGLSIRDKERSPSVEINEVEEEKAIKERRFYLHPSPRDRGTKVVEPELLPLFPLSSPGTSGPS